MVQVENLRAIEGGKAVEVEYLGYLLWHTVSNVLKIPGDKLEEELMELDLEKYMPKKISPRDAFRRVTKAMEVYRAPHGENTYLNLLVRDVRATEGEIVKQIVREVVDGKNIRLEYKPVLQLRMGKIREGDTVDITPLIPKEELIQMELDVIEKLPRLQEEACNYYDGVHIRYLLWKMLQDCNPVSVRPNGGVLFIPQAYAEQVDKIKAVAKKLNEYEGNVKMWSVPVIDATEHREMVEESLEEQIVGDSNSLINEMKKLMEDSSKDPSVKIIQGYADRVRKLQELVKEYEDSLEFQAIKAQENLKLAQQFTVQLMERNTLTE
jgi:hypothetical protein